MPNSYLSDGIFNLHRRTIMDSFSCIFFLRQLHLDLNMCCFINFKLKSLHFSIKKSTVRLLSYTLTSKRLVETNVNMTPRHQKWCQNRHTDGMHKSSYTPHVRWHFLPPIRVNGNPGWVCKNFWVFIFSVLCRDKNDCPAFWNINFYKVLFQKPGIAGITNWLLPCTHHPPSHCHFPRPQEPTHEILVLITYSDIGDQRWLRRACAVSPEPSLLAHIKYGRRQRVRPKIRHLAPLDICACTFKEWVYRGQQDCHNLMTWLITSWWDGDNNYKVLAYLCKHHTRLLGRYQVAVKQPWKSWRHKGECLC